MVVAAAERALRRGRAGLVGTRRRRGGARQRGGARRADRAASNIVVGARQRGGVSRATASSGAPLAMVASVAEGGASASPSTSTSRSSSVAAAPAARRERARAPRSAAGSRGIVLRPGHPQLFGIGAQNRPHIGRRRDAEHGPTGSSPPARRRTAGDSPLTTRARCARNRRALRRSGRARPVASRNC